MDLATAEDVGLLVEWVGVLRQTVPGPLLHRLLDDLATSLAQPVLLSLRDTALQLADDWLAVPGLGDALSAVLARLQSLLGDELVPALVVRPLE